ncbi:hypothetical protein DFH27DRAFT_655616 [Peziza echinospora]|nr:hypothetical protein DFH27DRAFT_655616 [Peziza echinospora]
MPKRTRVRLPGRDDYDGSDGSATPPLIHRTLRQCREDIAPQPPQRPAAPRSRTGSPGDNDDDDDDDTGHRKVPGSVVFINDDDDDDDPEDVVPGHAAPDPADQSFIRIIDDADESFVSTVPEDVSPPATTTTTTHRHNTRSRASTLFGGNRSSSAPGNQAVAEWLSGDLDSPARDNTRRRQDPPQHDAALVHTKVNNQNMTNCHIVYNHYGAPPPPPSSSAPMGGPGLGYRQLHHNPHHHPHPLTTSTAHRSVSDPLSTTTTTTTTPEPTLHFTVRYSRHDRRAFTLRSPSTHAEFLAKIATLWRLTKAEVDACTVALLLLPAGDPDPDYVTNYLSGAVMSDASFVVDSQRAWQKWVVAPARRRVLAEVGGGVGVGWSNSNKNVHMHMDDKGVVSMPAAAAVDGEDFEVCFAVKLVPAGGV